MSSRVQWDRVAGEEQEATWRGRPVPEWPWLRSVAWTATAFLGLVVLYRIVLPIPVPSGILIFGIVTGCINALIAVAIILIYRANRIINFAQAEIGVFGAILFENLYRATGVPYLFAIACGLFASAALGALVERVAVRRFFASPRLILTVATIGLAQIVVVLTYLLARLFDGMPVTNTSFETPFTGFTISLPSYVMDGDAILLLVTVPVIILLLNRFLRRTDFGIAVRASAESSERASLLGIPVMKVSTIMWIVAAAMTAMATILRSPVVGLVSGSTVQGQGLLLRALAAAVLARMDNLRVAVVAAIFLGVTEQALYWAYSGSSISDPIFVAIIIVGLLVQRRSTSRAGDEASSTWAAAEVMRPLPPELRGVPLVVLAKIAVAALGGLVVVLYGVLASPSQANIGAVIAIYAIVAMSLVVLMGWAGQLSLGQFGLVGFGAGVAGRLVADANTDFLLGMVAGGVVAALVAMVLGLVALKVTGFYFAVTSLAFAVSVQTFFLNPRFFDLLIPTNRPLRPYLFDRFDLADETAFYWFAVVIALLVALVLLRLRRSRTGRILNAVRDNERGAQSYGVSQARAKLTAFATSGFIAGMAGAMLAVHQHSVTASAYSVQESLRVFSMAVIGGVGSILGGVLGAIFVRVTANVLPAQFAVLATGVGLLLVLYLLPGGLVRALYGLRDRFLRRLANAHGIHVPSLVADVRTEDVRAEDVGTEGDAAQAGELDITEVLEVVEEHDEARP